MNSTKSIRILVLDDEPIVCKRLQPALEKRAIRLNPFLKASRP